MTAPSPAQTIDIRGVHESTEILEQVVGALYGLAVGETLEVITDDFSAIATELESWSRVTGHEIRSTTPAAEGVSHVITKGPPLPVAEKLVAVIASADRSQFATPMGASRAAGLEGLDVSVFFRDSGVLLLSKYHSPRRRLRDWLRGRRYPHPHGDVFRLFDHGAHIYACGVSLERHGMTPEDLLFENITVAEYATMVEIMRDADIHV